MPLTRARRVALGLAGTDHGDDEEAGDARTADSSAPGPVGLAITPPITSRTCGYSSTSSWTAVERWCIVIDTVADRGRARSQGAVGLPPVMGSGGGP